MAQDFIDFQIWEINDFEIRKRNKKTPIVGTNIVNGFSCEKNAFNFFIYSSPNENGRIVNNLKGRLNIPPFLSYWWRILLKDS